MKVIVPSVEIMRTGLETEVITPEKFIEKVGRTCYKSEDKITDDSAAKFVGNLIKRGHEAMIEHWSLIFNTSFYTYNDVERDWRELLENANKQESGEQLRPYIRFTNHRDDDGVYHCVISGNMRAWRDFAKACVCWFGYMPRYMHGMIRNYPLFFPEFQDYVPPIIVNDIMIPISVRELSDSERRVHQDVTIKFVCDRGVSHEMVRHRVASFAQESTRYCNYVLDKFGSEITVVRPYFLGGRDDGRIPEDRVYTAWENSCKTAEEEYFNLLKMGCTPQEARSVLPNSLKTEIIVTMNLDGWDHFFGLRCAPTAHPDMQEVAKMAEYLFEKELGDNE